MSIQVYKSFKGTANYNEKEYAVRQAWVKVLAAPAKPRQSGRNNVASLQAKPVAKLGFFSKLFKVV